MQREATGPEAHAPSGVLSTNKQRLTTIIYQMLNIAGPEYDFGNVVYVTIQECEHRRRSFDDEDLREELMGVARAKLNHIKKAYDEFGGSPTYWTELE